MLNHIESSHVNGVYHKCADCGVKFKTRNNLSSHKVKVHKQPKKDDVNENVKADTDKVDGELNTSFTETHEMTNNVSGSDDSGADNE